MSNFKSLKKAACEQLKGQWTQFAILTFVYFLLGWVVSFAESSMWDYSIITTLLLIPMAYSYTVLFLDNKRTGEPAKVEKLFVGYNDYLRITGTALLEYVYLILWALLLIIPAFVKGMAYSQTQFVLKDNPELSYNAAIERSMAMMQGHKWDFFCLFLSFIGWILLEIITFGIAAIWVTPYMNATFANYYEELKAEYEQKIAA